MAVIVIGDRELAIKLRRMAGEAGPVFAAALMAEAEPIMTASKMICPVLHGNLRNTGHVSGPEMTATGATVTLAYGGPAVDYAVVQHEHTEYSHTHGEAKYLEKPTMAAIPGMPTRIGKHIALQFEKYRSA